MVVKDLGRLGQVAAELEKTKLAELAAIAYGAKGTEDFAGPIVRQMGFDPRKPEGFREAGVDGTKGLAYGGDEQGAQLLVIGVADAGKLDAYVAGLAQKLGATSRAEVQLPAAPGAKAITFAAEGQPPALAYALKGGWAVIAVQQGAVDGVGRALARPREQSLEKSADWTALATKLGDRDVLLWAPPDLKLGKRSKTPESGVAVGVRASRTGVNARLVLPQTPMQLAVLKPAGTPAGMELVPHLPPKSFFALRLGGEPQALQPLLELVVPRRIAIRLKKAGFDLGSDVLGLLKPGIAVGVGLAEGLNFSGGIPGAEGGVDTFNPFQFVNLSLYARVKDPAAAAATLEKLAASDDKFGMEVTARGEGAAKVYTATYSQGEGMTWGLVGDALIATGGTNQFEQAKARLQKADPPLTVEDPAAKQVFDGAASAAHLDMPRLVGALRAVPESAYGVGGFRIKEIMETWIAMLDEVKGVTASFTVDDTSLTVDADLGLK